MTFQTALIYAAHWYRLKLLCFAVWTAFNAQAPRAKDADAVADAIATAVMFDSSAVQDDEHETALAARWAVEESWLKPHAIGDGGEARGIFQLHSAAGRGPLDVQTRGWLAMLHEGARICPESPAAPLSGGCVRARKLADRRTKGAYKVLEQFLEEDASPLDDVSPLDAPSNDVKTPAPVTARRDEVSPRGGENSGL